MMEKELKKNNMASPNKNMKEGGDYSQSFEGGVGGYAPYKMKGHELPGIKQRGVPYNVGDPLNAEMEDGVSKKSGMLYAEGGVGSSPAKGIGAWFKKAADPLNLFKKKKQAEPEAAAAGGGDGSHTHGAGGEVAAAAEPAAPTEAAPGEETPVAPPVEGGVTDPAAPGTDPKLMNPLSDIRAKEKIERTGKSPSGIPIYEFNYIGGSNRYSGAMAQDLLEMNIDAVSLGDDGYYRVNYNNIDVDMRLIN